MIDKIKNLYGEIYAEMVYHLLPLVKKEDLDLFIISAETRSGSTWLMEMLRGCLETLVQWEPLHPEQGILQNSDRNYGSRPLIYKDENDRYLREKLEQVFTYQSYNRWTVQHNVLSVLPNPGGILIKFVRANLLMPWILNNFHLFRKPIMLIRHPIPVSLSRISNFKNIRSNNYQFTVPNCINNDRYIRYKDYIHGLDTAIEKQVALWCINNIPAISDEEIRKNCLFVFYEDLLLNPQKELEKIMKSWGLRSYNDFKQYDKLRKKGKAPSNNKESDFVSHQLKKWKTNLDDNTLKDIQKIFDHFGFTLYNTRDTQPIKNKLNDQEMSPDFIRF